MRKTASHPAPITLRNIWAVIQAFFRKLKRGQIKELVIGEMPLPQYKWEQIVYRRIMVEKKSPQCWFMGSCRVCSCEILGKTMEDRACSVTEHPEILEHRDPCYPSMMTEKDWAEYKLKNNIKYFE